MRKYREFEADYPTETDPVSGNMKFETILTTIDLYAVVSFNPGQYVNQTSVRLSDNTMFDIRITYNKFKKLMQTEVPELFHTAN